MQDIKFDRQAICIQCHNKPELINSLLNNMPEKYFDFYIHVDKKSNIEEKICKQGNVYFCERLNVKWGRFSQVEATLKMFNLIDGKKYSYVHLISGNDYLIKSISYIKDFFSSDNQNQYIQSEKLPENSTWSWQGMDRFMVWYPQWLIQRPSKKIRRFIRIIYREFVMRTVVFRRKNQPVSNFFGGSQWFSITGECMEWMKTFLHEHPKYVNFFKHSVCCDEVFFATLIRYSPYQDKIMNENLRFMVWNDRVTGGPKELEKKDVDTMVGSKCVWARKIVTLEVVNLIQEKLSRIENTKESV